MVQSVYPAVYNWYIEKLQEIFDDCNIYETEYTIGRDIVYPAVFVGPIRMPRELYLQEMKNFSVLFTTVLADRGSAGDAHERREKLFEYYGKFVSEMDRYYFNLRIEDNGNVSVFPLLGDTVEVPEMNEDYTGPFIVYRVEWVYSVEFAATLT